MIRFVRPSGSPKAIGEHSTMTTRALVQRGTIIEITDRAGETINVAKVEKATQENDKLHVELVMIA
jgi:membrane-bound ClpP family serine protease